VTSKFNPIEFSHCVTSRLRNYENGKFTQPELTAEDMQNYVL